MAVVVSAATALSAASALSTSACGCHLSFGSFGSFLSLREVGFGGGDSSLGGFGRGDHVGRDFLSRREFVGRVFGDGGRIGHRLDGGFGFGGGVFSDVCCVGGDGVCGGFNQRDSFVAGGFFR